jgi:hypothetical protein
MNLSLLFQIIIILVLAMNAFYRLSLLYTHGLRQVLISKFRSSVVPNLSLPIKAIRLRIQSSVLRISLTARGATGTFVREEADGCVASINCWCFGSEVVAWRGVVGSLVSFSRENVDDSFTTRLSLLLPLYSSFSVMNVGRFNTILL